MAHVGAHFNKTRIRFSIRGKRYSALSPIKPTATNTRSLSIQAREWEARLQLGEPWSVIRAEIREEQRPAVTGTLGYYADHYFRTAEVERTTVIAAAKSYNRVWADFDDRPIATLLKSELEKHLDSFGYARKTKRNHVSVLRRIFECAKDDGYTGSCPTDRWRIGKIQKPKKDPYTPEERDQLLGAIPEGRFRTFFLIGFYCGMRTSEILALQPRHIRGKHIDVEQVRVDKELDLRTKTHSMRSVVAPKLVRDAVQPYRFQEWIFERLPGEPYLNANDFLEAFWAAHDATGVRRRQGQKKYPWRSTYISIALREGLKPGLVAKQTGHDERTMWESYAEYIPGDDDVSDIERVFG